jgi:hypothetical protein
LSITNYGIQKFDQNSTSKTISLNQTFEEFSENCIDFGRASDLDFSLIYSPHKRISVVELYFETDFVDYDCDTRSDKSKINFFVSPHRNCFKRMGKYPNGIYGGEHLEYRVFLCELNSLEDYNKETIILNSMRFSFKSEIKFRLRISKILIYRFVDESGFPHLPIRASILRIE